MEGFSRWVMFSRISETKFTCAGLVIAKHFIFLGVGVVRSKHKTPFSNMTGWWFQIFFIFTPIWGRFPF